MLTHRLAHLGATVDQAYAVVGAIGAWQRALGNQAIEKRSALRLRVIVNAVGVRQPSERVGDRPQPRSERVGGAAGVPANGAGRTTAQDDASLLAIKSVLDGFTSIAFAATLGWGVLLSIVVILVYQGGLAAGASLFSGLLTDPQLREMSAVGGLLILGVGLKLLKIRDVQVADFLPAIAIAPIIVGVVDVVKEAIGA